MQLRMQRRIQRKNRSRLRYTILLVIIAAGIAVGYAVVSSRLPSSLPADNAELVKHQSYQKYAKGDFKGAIPQLHSYLQKRQNDTAATNLLITCYIQEGYLAKALKEATKLAERTPTDPNALYRAAQIAQSLDRPKTAIPYLQKAIKIKPRTVQFHYQLAEAYTRAKNYKLAVREWRTVLGLLPTKEKHRGLVYGKIGDIHAKLGNTTSAKYAYDRGLIIMPDSPYLKKQARKIKLQAGE